MNAPRDAAVIIVGAGPAGLMLANELGHRGIATLLFCDRPSTSPYPQANATQARTMEFYRRLGFAEKLIALQRMGVEHVATMSNFGALAADRVEASMRLMIEQVLPIVQKATRT